jgi:Zn finger protein HypA/HybF involved in hydrogenase expression
VSPSHEWVADFSMHELSLVEELVATCCGRARGRAVRTVRVRCPASVNAEELREGFAFAVHRVAVSATDSCLVAAELKVEPVPVHLACACGYEGRLTEDQLAGHMSICPRCGHVGEVTDGLELVSMSFADDMEPFGPP